MTMPRDRKLRALALVCAVTQSAEPCSGELLAREVLDQLSHDDVAGGIIRVADRDRPGAERPVGGSDTWPRMRPILMDVDILVMTPTWTGEQSTVARRVIERLDAELSECDVNGRLRTYGKVTVAIVVDGEDGVTDVSAVLFQVLNDVGFGFSTTANAVTYWNATGEARDRAEANAMITRRQHPAA